MGGLKMFFNFFKFRKEKKKDIKIEKEKKLEVIGQVTHYFPHVKAAVIKIKKGPLVIGDSVQIKGCTTDFKQKIDSMQIDHKPITKATKGNEIGLKMEKRVRVNDLVYKL